MKSAVSDAFVSIGMEDVKDSKTEISSEPVKSKEGKHPGPALFVASESDKPTLVTAVTGLAKFAYVAEEVKTYSITPTTFKSRTLGTIKEFGDDFTWYIDEFTYNKSSVLRFGINAAKIIPSKFKLNSKVIEQKSADLRSVGSQNNPKELEARANRVTHEDLEKYLIGQAVKHLLELTEDKNSHFKTVLVDIFARDNQGRLILQENGLLETHSVVLYKNPISKNNKYDITVIDPSNFSFSSHIANISVTHELLGKIISFNSSLQLYRKADGSKTGPEADQYRDCIDVAAKLAFMLENSNWQSLTDIQVVKTSDSIKAISNIATIDKAIITKEAVARVKQASDVKVVKAFYGIQLGVEKMLDMLSISSDELSTKYKKEYGKIVMDQGPYGELLSKLMKVDKGCKERIKSDLDESYKQLIGMVQEIEEIDI